MDDIEPLDISEPTSWKPTQRQDDFIQLPDSIFEGLYGGALGGGKTFCLIYLPIARRFHEHYAFRGIIFRRTFPELEKYVIPLAERLYTPLGAKYNGSEHYFRFPTGARIFLAHMEQEKDVIKHKTNEYHYVGIDQAELFTEYQLRYITSRIRTSHKALPKLFRMSANPGGVSHTFLYKRYVKPAINGNVILFDPLAKTKRIFIPAKIEDNTYLQEADPDYVHRLNLLPEKERDALINGNWESLAGAVFTEFRTKKIPSEPENALHVIEPFEIPDWWPKIVAIDWGFSAYTCALWGAISPDDRLFVYREYHQNKTSIANWASDIARLSQFDGNIKKVVIDPSARQNRGEELTIEQQFTKWSKFVPHLADNDRVGGKQLIHDYLRFIQKKKRYIPQEGYNHARFDYILRVYGLHAAKDYQKLFTPEPDETNLPRLQIFKHCVNVIEQISTAQYDENHKEDVKKSGWQDDAYDTLRYLLKSSDHYLREVTKEHEIRKMYGEAEKIKETDMHAFAMRMAFIEKKIKSDHKPVKLYH